MSNYVVELFGDTMTFVAAEHFQRIEDAVSMCLRLIDEDEGTIIRRTKDDAVTSVLSVDREDSIVLSWLDIEGIIIDTQTILKSNLS